MPRLFLALLLTSSLLAGGPQAVPAEAPAVSSHAAAIDGLLARRYEPDQPGAVVLVLKEGRTVLRKAYGLASLELDVPMRPENVFRVGSLTKQVTAAAVLRLAEEGRLELKAPIARYLEGLPKAWEAVTVEQLLTHTAGIPSHKDQPTYKVRMREDLTPAELLEAFVAHLPLEFEPGTKYRYSDTGYILLGMLIEQLSGQPYGEFVEKRFFEPLGLKHMQYGSETELIPGLVPGYTKGPKPCAYRSTTQAYASGGLVSDADDVARWLLALYEGKVLKPESLARMMTPLKLKDGKEVGYGYGIGFRPLGKVRLAGHAGGVPGFKSWAETDPASRTVVVILNNTDAPKGDDMVYAKCIFAILAGMPYQEPQ